MKWPSNGEQARNQSDEARPPDAFDNRRETNGLTTYNIHPYYNDCIQQMQEYNHSYVHRSGARVCRVERRSLSPTGGRSLDWSKVALQESTESCTFA